jgi:hypothetical protein
MGSPRKAQQCRPAGSFQKADTLFSAFVLMRSTGPKTLLPIVLMALALLVPSAAPAAAGAPTGGTSPSTVEGAGASSSGGAGVSGQGQQLSKLTGEQTPEEKEEEIAEQNAAAAKASESKPVSTGLLVLIGSAAAILIGGIAFLILRDARSMAPANGMPTSGSNRDRAARRRKQRAKAKVARQSRKRNR